VPENLDNVYIGEVNSKLGEIVSKFRRILVFLFGILAFLEQTAVDFALLIIAQDVPAADLVEGSATANTHFIAQRCATNADARRISRIFLAEDIHIGAILLDRDDSGKLLVPFRQ